MVELTQVAVRSMESSVLMYRSGHGIHLSDAYKKILLPSDKWSGEVMMYNLDVVIAVGYRWFVTFDKYLRKKKNK